MKRLILTILSIVAFAMSAHAGTPLNQNDYSWMDSIRTYHPRIFLTSEDIPRIRKAAFSFEQKTYSAMKDRVESIMGKPIVFENPLEKTGEGKPERLYGYYAADAAMMWLITQNRKYLDFTKEVLDKLLGYYELRVSHNLNIEWYALTQVCALCAYDWIYNDLASYERKKFGRRLFNVMCDIAWHGPDVRQPRYRENISDYKSGCYGVSILPWYIGLTFWKEGYDDSFCEDMLKNGYGLHCKMVEFRSEMLGKNGGGASGVPGYALAYYPYAEYDFMYTFKSATGIDLSERMSYMTGYLKYMDWIRLPDNLEYGFGDCNHYNCRLPHTYMNAHVWEIANLFGEKYPEILPVAARLLTKFTSTRPMDAIPFLRLLHKINPLDGMVLTDTDYNVAKQPKSMYFDTMGQLYMRSGVNDTDTYAMFVTGGSTSQHKHYDNNNFIIYKYGFRALDSGTRPEPGYHLPYYYARTIAHNCVTILMPGETFPAYWGGPAACEEKNLEMPNDGGQCSLLGSNMLKLVETDDYVYVASDASACYNPDKTDLVVRELIWCQSDVFVIFDRVVSDKAEYAKSWLFHTAAEPVFKGGREFSEKSQGGKTICRTLYPEDAILEKVGGPGKQFWSGGRNWPIPTLTPEDYGYAQRNNIPPNDHPLVGQWRVEVRPASARKDDFFLHIIQVGDEKLRRLPDTHTFEDDNNIILEFRYLGKNFRLSFDKNSKYGCDISVTVDRK